MIGDTLKRRYAGYTAWLISSDIQTIRFIGLRPSRKITVFNGPLECRLLKFEVFAGKKGYQGVKNDEYPNDEYANDDYAIDKFADGPED